MPKHNQTSDQISYDYYYKATEERIRFEIANGQVRNPDGQFLGRREDEVRSGLDDDEESPIRTTNDGDEFVPLEEFCYDGEDEEECEDEEPEELPDWYFTPFQHGAILGTRPGIPRRADKRPRPDRVALVRYTGPRRYRRKYELLAA